MFPKWHYCTLSFNVSSVKSFPRKNALSMKVRTLEVNFNNVFSGVYISKLEFFKHYKNTVIKFLGCSKKHPLYATSGANHDCMLTLLRDFLRRWGIRSLVVVGGLLLLCIQQQLQKVTTTQFVLNPVPHGVRYNLPYIDSSAFLGATLFITSFYVHI